MFERKQDVESEKLETYEVDINVSYKKTVVVNAENDVEARKTAQENWKKGKYRLCGKDGDSVYFNVKEKVLFPDPMPTTGETADE